MSTRIVYFADHPSAVALLRGSAALSQVAIRVEAGLLHTKRVEDALLGESIERRVARLLDDGAEQNVADIAVGELAPRRRDRLQSEQVLPSLVLPGLTVFERIVGDEPAR